MIVTDPRRWWWDGRGRPTAVALLPSQLTFPNLRQIVTAARHVFSRYEDFAQRRPWLAAIAPAAFASIFATGIALLTSQSAAPLRVGIPVAFATWLLLGASARVRRLPKD